MHLRQRSTGTRARTSSSSTSRLMRTRQTIPYVRVVDAQGKTTEYLAEGVTARPAGELLRDGLHRLPQPPGAHVFELSVDKAVDALIASGAVKRDAAVR